VARIVAVETAGVVLPETTAEAFRDHLDDIDELSGTYHQPVSLDDETMIIAKALSEV
jgi:hypothetical protein